MTGVLRTKIQNYTQVIKPLQDCKTLLLKGVPTSGHQRRSIFLKTIIENPSAAELAVFEYLKAKIAEPSNLVHFDKSRVLWMDLDTNKKAATVQPSFGGCTEGESASIKHHRNRTAHPTQQSVGLRATAPGQWVTNQTPPDLPQRQPALHARISQRSFRGENALESGW